MLVGSLLSFMPAPPKWEDQKIFKKITFIPCQRCGHEIRIFDDKGGDQKMIHDH